MHTKNKVIAKKVRLNLTKRSTTKPKYKLYIVAADSTLNP